ncbi:hypothetical protein [Bacillus pumilus]|uniref:hypothetical protein n=1 Tax=Bacillus pumilus TaxID=1408 RepID=UPI0011A015F3|nr:hypothetical protein [Bacillus pumilus]
MKIGDKFVNNSNEEFTVLGISSPRTLMPKRNLNFGLVTLMKSDRQIDIYMSNGVMFTDLDEFLVICESLGKTYAVTFEDLFGGIDTFEYRDLFLRTLSNDYDLSRLSLSRSFKQMLR